MSDNKKDLSFQIGDFVLYLLDGDVGLILDVDPGSEEPYNVKWYMHPGQSGWHSAHHSEHSEPIMIRLGE